MVFSDVCCILTPPLFVDIACFTDDGSDMLSGEILDIKTGPRTKLPDMNVARSFYPSAVAIRRGAGHRIYMFGGGDYGADLIDSCEFLDVGDDQWTLLEAKMTTPRACACAVLLDHTTIVICGGSACGAAAGGVSSCESLDLNTHTFSSFPDMLVPRFGHAGVLYSGTVVVIGGGQKEKTCEQFDPAVFKWTPFAPISEERGGCVDAAVVNGMIYALVSYDKSVRVYDGAAWTTVTHVPRSFVAPPVVAFGGKFIVIPAHKTDADVFDPATNSWSSLPAMIPRGYYHSAISF